MTKKIDDLLKESNKAFNKMIGSSGCDLVTGTDAFPARRGLIWAAISNADATRIASITEVDGGISKVITSRTYLGAVDFDKGALITFDAPVSSITLSAGSLWVYYV